MSFLTNSAFIISKYDRTKLFQNDGYYEFYLLNSNKYKLIYKFDDKYYCSIARDITGKLILTIANERDFSKRGLNLIETHYEINELDFSYFESTKQDLIFPTYTKYRWSNQPKTLYKIYYDTDNAYAKIGDYFLIAQDMLNHGITVNKAAPEKHAYLDMDLCLVDENGDVSAILPFTVDDQAINHIEILEASPKEKFVKIKASSGYAFAKINDDLLEKYPELKHAIFYFIYEISDDEKEKDVEIIDLSEELNIQPQQEITLPAIYKDYSLFNTRIEKGIQAICIDSNAPIRVSFDLGAKSLGYLNKNDRVRILQCVPTETKQKCYNWYKVETSYGITGWVDSEYLKVEKDELSYKKKSLTDEVKEHRFMAKCNDFRVRIREKASLDGKTLGHLDNGAKVKVKEKSPETFEIDGELWYWYKIETSDDKVGWVYGKYLDIEE